MSRYGCLGERLPHSFSKEIHEKIGAYPYELLEVAPGDLDAFLIRRDFTGINVTIPYKEKVIPYLSEISDRARRIGAVNTVVNRDGKLYGDNTDYAGLRALAQKTGIDFSGKKVLVLGTGGTSKTALAVARDGGAADVFRVSRTRRENAVSYEEAYRAHADAQIIINTTPCGMFPELFASPVELNRFPRLCGVLDAVYNPLRTELVLQALSMGIPAAGGLYMLVAQATAAAEIFTASSLPDDLTDRIFRELTREKENIVLIGMPSCGKTSVGKRFAQRKNLRWMDTDDEIYRRTGRSPAQIIETFGEERFRQIETETLRQLAAQGGAVISTGGGTVLRNENVQALRHNGRIFWLNRRYELLTPTPDRPLSDSPEKLRRLAEVRRPFYEAAADEIIDANGSVEACADEIEARLTL